MSFTGVADGTWYFHVRADGAAGWGSTSTVQVNIDTTPPVTTASGLSNTSPGWSNSDTVSLSATDDSGSGVSHTYYALDGNGQQTYSGTLTLQSGAHTLTYWSVDKAGNVEAHHTGYLDVDTAAPTTTATGLSVTPDPAWSTGRVSLSADDSGSGVAATYYKIDGGDQKTYTVAFTLPEGAHTVTYWSVDKAGNTEDVQTGYARVDTTGPALTVSGASNGAWLNHAVTLTLQATDSGSGVAAIHYTLDGVAHTVSAATTQVKLAALPNKTHTLTCTATDAVGNTSVVHSLTVHIDTVGPSTDAVAASGRVHKTIVLRYRVRDNMSSQCRSVALVVRNSRGKIVKWFSLGTVKVSHYYTVSWKPAAKGIYRYTVTATDLAGNHQAKAGSARITVK